MTHYLMPLLVGHAHGSYWLGMRMGAVQAMNTSLPAWWYQCHTGLCKARTRWVQGMNTTRARHEHCACKRTCASGSMGITMSSGLYPLMTGAAEGLQKTYAKSHPICVRTSVHPSSIHHVG